MLCPSWRAVMLTVKVKGSNLGGGTFFLMSIVLNVHPGVQLDTRVDSKKVFAVRSWKGPSCI